MKNTLLVAVVLLTMVACQKNPELTPVNEPVVVANPTPGQVPVAKILGTFMSEVHPTSGTVKVVETSAGVRSLAFENFKTDSGPDLRVYLADDKKATNFIEVALLTKTGTFSLPLPAGYPSEKQKYVLIWCRQFTVLFGSAELK
ncbi:MAG: DM13 domain-containing protein [Cytophagaceae bacterium]|nr:DM13 domain-containing protein [Cytophagaceae bacterium]